MLPKQDADQQALRGRSELSSWRVGHPRPGLPGCLSRGGGSGNAQVVVGAGICATSSGEKAPLTRPSFRVRGDRTSTGMVYRSASKNLKGGHEGHYESCSMKVSQRGAGSCERLRCAAIGRCSRKGEDDEQERMDCRSRAG